MEKIVRLSWANIRKHKIESVSLVILVMLCMLLAGSALSGSIGIKTIFPQLMEQTGSYENYALIDDKAYDKEYENILRRDSRVEDTAVSELLYSMSANYVNTAGKEQGMFMAFITAENEAKLQHSERVTTLSDAELAALEHPVWMPHAAKDNLHVNPGDTFTAVFGSRKYNFTVAGFYDTMFLDNTSSGLKMIVSENDYHSLASVMTLNRVLAYNDHQGQGSDTLADDCLKAFEDYSGKDAKSGCQWWTYETIRAMIDTPIDAMLKLILAMAGIIILSVLLMIRFRIAGDIKEQIVSIGVLEALGYTSNEITLSYVIEYLLIAVVGMLPGLAGCYVLTPLLYNVGAFMVGHQGNARVRTLPILLTAAAILLLVALIAFIRARMVRKYPPVQAFRKGQGDHRFGREHFPLSKTKHSVHLRLAMKGFLTYFKQSLGLTVCITVSAAAIITSFIMFSVFGTNYHAIEQNAGMEISDLRVEVMPYVDAKELAEELAERPEVRKATPTTGYTLYVSLPDYNNTMLLPMTFSSFDVTENIFPMTGRFPEHDNEIMLNNMLCKLQKIKCGDTVTLEYLNVKRRYMVTGIVTSMTNGTANLYMTEDAMKRLYPNFRPDIIEVYLEAGIDPDTFRHILTDEYGRSIADAAKEAENASDTESRIRAEAERQMAELLASGTSHVEYAIQYGDKLITGNSDNFRIRSVMNLHDILETQLYSSALAISAITVMFIILSAVVVMIILFILMESSVRKQRRELGIMKGMGYTSKELMLQLASRIMPAAVFAVIAGTGCGFAVIQVITSYFGRIGINVPAVILLDVLLLVFCFGCAYIGARKIKQISVYELMTE